MLLWICLVQDHLLLLLFSLSQLQVCFGLTHLWTDLLLWFFSLVLVLVLLGLCPLLLLLQLLLGLEAPAEVQQSVLQLLVLGAQRVQARAAGQGAEVESARQSVLQAADLSTQRLDLLLLNGQTCSHALRHLSASQLTG